MSAHGVAAQLITNPDAVQTHWRALAAAGTMHEVCALDCGEGPKKWGHQQAVGYFNSPEAVAAALHGASGVDASGVYLTLNPVLPELIMRKGQSNTIKAWTQQRTTDEQVLRRTALLLDVDARTPVSGISATDGERDRALARTHDLLEELARYYGWPDPICVLSSGNGGALLSLIELHNDASSERLVQRVLAALGARYSDERASFDTRNYNAARLTKLAGAGRLRGRKGVAVEEHQLWAEVKEMLSKVTEPLALRTTETESPG
jgi:hypothetical protein